MLWVGTSGDDGQLTLRLRYRTDVLDADAAARIAGYHLTTLELIVAIWMPSTVGRACCPPRSCTSSSKGSPDRGGAARPPGSGAFRGAGGGSP